MQKVSLPGLPARRAADYKLDEFTPPRYARVVYVPEESRADRKVIEAQAFEIDENGNFVSFTTGAPSRTPGTKHMIQMSGIGDNHTLQPGWVRIVGDYQPDSVDPGKQVPERAVWLEPTDARPTNPQAGDLIWQNNTLYAWNEGLIEQIMRGKAEELIGIIRNANAIQDFEL